jgi:hypothetical protein
MASCSIVTPSYIRDLALAKELCSSIDKFVSPDIQHILVVPAGDRPSFAELESERRRVITQESVIPWYFKRIPAPRKLHIPGIVNRPLRQVWLSPVGLLSGWLIANSIVKIAAPSYCNTDIIVLADSDMGIIRPIDAKTFEVNGKIPLHAKKVEPIHQAWHRSAAKLLGLPPKDYFGADFIGHLVAWKRENVVLLQKHIESTMGAPWPLAVARLRDVAETITYGVFCQEILGEKSGHVFFDGYTHSYWFGDWEDGRSLDKFVDGFSEDSLAVLIQSTIPLEIEERRRVLDEIIKRVA